uniref:Putative secreted protein n=1 Tax=Anopheles darlingi TaxID=43151 RepID=A0A2M4DN19_ANODA
MVWLRCVIRLSFPYPWWGVERRTCPHQKNCIPYKNLRNRSGGGKGAVETRQMSENDFGKRWAARASERPSKRPAAPTAA